MLTDKIISNTYKGSSSPLSFSSIMKATGLKKLPPQGYTIWLNYDNDKKKYIFPVLPEKLNVSANGISTSLTIDRLGEIFHKGRREALTVSWSSFFPAKFSSQYCSCSKKNYHLPKTMHNWIMDLMNASNPAHLVVTGGPFNLDIYVLIKSYKAYEEGGDVGTIHYSIELKEYRTVTIKKIQTKKKTVTTTKKRVNNTVKKKIYTVKKGDTLRKIAKKYYGHKSQSTKIYKANKDLIEKTAKKHGHHSSHHGKYIYEGTQLVIP